MQYFFADLSQKLLAMLKMMLMHTCFFVRNKTKEASLGLPGSAQLATKINTEDRQSLNML